MRLLANENFPEAAVIALRAAGFANSNADLLFQVVSRRYERKSLVLTTNLAFKDWNTIFPNAACATALIERIVHHADIVTIEGASYRVRESQRDAQKRRDSRRGGPKAPSAAK